MKIESTTTKKWPVVLAGLIDGFLIMVSLPFLLTICGLSIMAFDAPDSMSKWQPWVLVLSVSAGSIASVVIAMIGTVRMLQARKLFKSLVFAAIPLICLGLFFTVVNLL